MSKAYNKMPEKEVKNWTRPMKDKRMLTLFILMVPSLLLAMTSAISSLIIRVGFQAVLLLLHFVLIKNLIDSYSGEE